MEHYQNLQQMDPHAIVLGVVECLVFLAAVTLAAVKLFRSF